jgi:hypothetical protein
MDKKIKSIGLFVAILFIVTATGCTEKTSGAKATVMPELTQATKGTYKDKVKLAKEVSTSLKYADLYDGKGKKTTIDNITLSKEYQDIASLVYTVRELSYDSFVPGATKASLEELSNYYIVKDSILNMNTANYFPRKFFNSSIDDIRLDYKQHKSLDAPDYETMCRVRSSDYFFDEKNVKQKHITYNYLVKNSSGLWKMLKSSDYSPANTLDILDKSITNAVSTYLFRIINSDVSADEANIACSDKQVKDYIVKIANGIKFDIGDKATLKLKVDVLSPKTTDSFYKHYNSAKVDVTVSFTNKNGKQEIANIKLNLLRHEYWHFVK